MKGVSICAGSNPSKGMRYQPLSNIYFNNELNQSLERKGENWVKNKQ